ncbi:MAG: hypothetical protein P4K86_08855 [Terracidiphilus sp.]|nr:hypothetical protein [Terracidiphilus sp.]
MSETIGLSWSSLSLTESVKRGWLGACLLAGIRLARERQVNVRVVPTDKAIEESVDLAYEVINRGFQEVPDNLKKL